MKTKLTLHSFLQARSLKLATSFGFTLVEIVVAFGMFSVIMVIAVGSLLSLIEANHKAQAQKTVVNNLHFALENMSRNIRTGSNYHCGDESVTSVTIPQDCQTTPATQLVFKERDGGYVLYTLENETIKRSKNQSAIDLLLQEKIPITAPEIQVEHLNFYVDGADNTLDSGSNKKQPRVLIVLKGSMQGKSKVISRFDIQTLVSQRGLDI